MKLEDPIEKFSAAVGIENVPAVEGVWKFSADGNVFGVTGDETGNVDSITERLGGKRSIAISIAAVPAMCSDRAP